MNEGVDGLNKVWMNEWMDAGWWWIGWSVGFWIREQMNEWLYVIWTKLVIGGLVDGKWRNRWKNKWMSQLMKYEWMKMKNENEWINGNE